MTLSTVAARLQRCPVALTMAALAVGTLPLTTELVTAIHPPIPDRYILLPGGYITGAFIFAAGVFCRRSRIARTQAPMAADIMAQAVHDMRTPLTVLRGFSEVLASDAEPPREMRREWARMMQVEANHLSAMLDELLELLRAEAGRTSVVCDTFVLRELIDEVVLPYRQTPTHPIRVELNGSPTVHGDRLKIGRALTNLLANAVKYSPEGRPIMVAANDEEDGIRIEVHDSGPGVPEEEREQIFEPFFRGAYWKTGTSSVPGTGLGLAIVRSVARLHQGEATATNARVGAVFALTLRSPQGCEHVARPAPVVAHAGATTELP